MVAQVLGWASILAPTWEEEASYLSLHVRAAGAAAAVRV